MPQKKKLFPLQSLALAMEETSGGREDGKYKERGGERMSIVWIVVENREGGGEERRW